MIRHLPKSETPFILFEEYDILFHLEWLDSTVVTILLLWLVLFFSASLPSLWHFSRSCAYTPFPVDLDISLVTMSVGEAPKFTATRAPDLFPGVFAPFLHAISSTAQTMLKVGPSSSLQNGSFYFYLL